MFTLYIFVVVSVGNHKDTITTTTTTTTMKKSEPRPPYDRWNAAGDHCC